MKFLMFNLVVSGALVYLLIGEGGLNGSTQHFNLRWKDGVYCDGTKITSRFHCGREDGVVGSLATRGISEGDWACVWQAIVVYLRPCIAARRDPAGAPAALEAGIDAPGT